MVVSATQWPHGIAWLANVLHQNGFKLGVYTDAGATGCGVKGGAFGHYQQDINTLAAWGVDAVKVDWCGGSSQGLDPARPTPSSTRRSSTTRAIARCCWISATSCSPARIPATNFPALQQSAFFSYSFGPSDGQSWRTDTDVGVPGNVPFSRCFATSTPTRPQPQAAGPGHWNDPDYLGPDQGMNAAQFRTQFSMWAMLAAPLMVSDNMTKISAAPSDGYEQARDRDRPGPGRRPGRRGLGVRQRRGLGQAAVQPQLAIALLNRGSTTISISTTAAALARPSIGEQLPRQTSGAVQSRRRTGPSRRRCPPLDGSPAGLRGLERHGATIRVAPTFAGDSLTHAASRRAPSARASSCRPARSGGCGRGSRCCSPGRSPAGSRGRG